MSQDNIKSSIIKRQSHLDTISGILILWMIFQHYNACTGLLLKGRYIPLLFCFMAWFFFKAGMFHRIKSSSEIIRTGYKRLIIPYIIFSIIGYLTGYLTLFIKQVDCNILHYTLSSIKQIVISGGVDGDKPIWFLLSLFVVKVIFNFIARHDKATYIIPIIAYICAYTLYKLNIEHPCYLGNICIGIVFYSLGYLLRKKQYDKCLLIVAIPIYIYIYIFTPSNVDVRANTCNSGLYGLYYLGSICSIIILNNTIRSISLRFSILEYIGRHSMSYYLTHWLIMILTRDILTQWCSIVEPSWHFTIISILSVILLPLFDKVLHKKSLKWMIGE